MAGVFCIVHRRTGEMDGRSFEHVPDYREAISNRVGRTTLNHAGAQIAVSVSATGRELTIFIKGATGEVENIDIAEAIGEDEFSIGYAQRAGLTQITVEPVNGRSSPYTPVVIYDPETRTSLSVEWHEDAESLDKEIAQNPFKRVA